MNLSKLTEAFLLTLQRVLQLKSSHLLLSVLFWYIGLVHIHWETGQRSITQRPNSCVKGLACLCLSHRCDFSHTSKCVWCWRNVQTTALKEFLLFLCPANTRRHETICTSRCFKRQQLAGGVITANGGDDVAKNENISDVYVVIIFNLDVWFRNSRGKWFSVYLFIYV